MEQRMTFFEKIRKHKRAIIVTGIGAIAVMGGVFIWKNCDTVLESAEVFQDLRENASLMKVGNTASALVDSKKEQKIITFQVKGFVRNLPEGYHPSPLKVATAAENGFELGEQQTWVRPSIKTRVA